MRDVAIVEAVENDRKETKFGTYPITRRGTARKWGGHLRNP
jgi:hypothetical protein